MGGNPREAAGVVTLCFFNGDELTVLRTVAEDLPGLDRGRFASVDRSVISAQYCPPF
jgi:hypothetical protein